MGKYNNILIFIRYRGFIAPTTKLKLISIDTANNSRLHLLNEIRPIDHKSEIYYSQKNMDANSSAETESALYTHQAISTLCASQNQPGIRHVIAQVDVRSSAQNAPSFL